MEYKRLEFDIPEGVEPDTMYLAAASQVSFRTDWVKRTVTAAMVNPDKVESFKKLAAEQGLKEKIA